MSRAQFDEWFDNQTWILANKDLAYKVWQAGAAAEREACAKIAETLQNTAGDVLAKDHNDDAAAQYDTAMEIAEAIRERGSEAPLSYVHFEDCGCEKCLEFARQVTAEQRQRIKRAKKRARK